MRGILADGLRIAHIRGCVVRDCSVFGALAQECGNACIQDVEEYRRNESRGKNVCSLLCWNIDHCVSGEDVHIQELRWIPHDIVAEYMMV